MLADNHAQAFSVARLTAMFSALLRTCDTEVVLRQGQVRTVVNAQVQDWPTCRLICMLTHTAPQHSSPTTPAHHPQDYFLRNFSKKVHLKLEVSPFTFSFSLSLSFIFDLSSFNAGLLSLLTISDNFNLFSKHTLTTF